MKDLCPVGLRLATLYKRIGILMNKAVITEKEREELEALVLEKWDILLSPAPSR